MQFVRSQHQMAHIPERWFIVGNRPPEGAERSHQDFEAIEIGTHMGEFAMQLAPYSIYSRRRAHCCQLAHASVVAAFMGKHIGRVVVPVFEDFKMS